MHYRRLGQAGLQVSALSFGAWVTFGQQIGQDMAERLMRTAFDAGVNFFDNAESYAGGNAEAMMGNVFKSTGWRRESYVVSTKLYSQWNHDSVGSNRPPQVCAAQSATRSLTEESGGTQ